MEVGNVLLKLPKNALLLGILLNFGQASILDCVHLQSLISKNFDNRLVDNDYLDLDDDELFTYCLGQYLLKKGKNINECLEDVYQQFSDENLLMAYKQAIKEFKKTELIKNIGGT